MPRRSKTVHDAAGFEPLPEHCVQEVCILIGPSLVNKNPEPSHRVHLNQSTEPVAEQVAHGSCFSLLTTLVHPVKASARLTFTLDLEALDFCPLPPKN